MSILDQVEVLERLDSLFAFFLAAHCKTNQLIKVAICIHPILSVYALTSFDWKCTSGAMSREQRRQYQSDTRDANMAVDRAQERVEKAGQELEV